MMSKPTLAAKPVNAKKKETFERNGYLLLENFISEEECDQLRERIHYLMQDFNPNEVRSIFDTNPDTHTSDKYFMDSGDKISFFFEKDAFCEDGSLKQSKERSLNKIGHALHDLDPVFETFSYSPKIKHLTLELGIANPTILQSMYIFKQPEIGGEVDCHQDGSFLISEPDSVVGLWFALEDATKENGCLWALPEVPPLKSHYVRKDNSTEFIYYDNSPWNLKDMIALEVPKGTAIALHSRLPHMSFANTSGKSRHAYTLHLMDSSSRYSEQNWLQRGDHLPFRKF